MYHGWFELGGAEVVNTNRTFAYAQNFGLNIQCEGCPTTPEATGALRPYEAPSVDPAPWYDPTVPESSQFFGFTVLDVEGPSAVPSARSVTERAGDGALLGPLRVGARTVTVTAQLVARDECALEYGVAWLASVARDTSDTRLNVGEQLCFLSCCPTSGDGAKELRTLFDVGLTSGPEPDEAMVRRGNYVTRTYTWEWTAGKPHIYWSRDYAQEAGLSSGRVPMGRDGELTVDPMADPCPPEPLDCGSDPNCPDPPTPPAPPEPNNPCYPTNPYRAAATMVSIPPQRTPSNLDLVPFVQISSGSNRLRRVAVRFRWNPAGLPCTGRLDPCSSCGEITLPNIPEATTLTIDGRTQRATMDCAGNRPGTLRRAPAILYGRAGRIFQWPVMECTPGLCVEVLAQANTIAANASCLVEMIPRQGAS